MRLTGLLVALMVTSLGSAEARVLLQDAEPASCQFGPICIGCGTSPVVVDPATSRIRDLADGNTAMFCFVNTAVSDFTLDVAGCQYKATIEDSGRYTLAVSDVSCPLTPGCITVRAKGACVELTHTCGQTFAAMTFSAQKCASEMVMATTAATAAEEPACKLGYCGKCDKDCKPPPTPTPTPPVNVCIANCAASDTIRCRDSTACRPRSTQRAVLVRDAEYEASCVGPEPASVPCPPCKCECSCTPKVTVNGVVSDTPVAGTCTSSGEQTSPAIECALPPARPVLNRVARAECGLRGSCECSKTGQVEKTGSSTAELVACPLSGGTAFPPCQAGSGSGGYPGYKPTKPKL